MGIIIQDRIDRNIIAEAHGLPFGLEGFVLAEIIPDGIIVPFH